MTFTYSDATFQHSLTDRPVIRILYSPAGSRFLVLESSYKYDAESKGRGALAINKTADKQLIRKVAVVQNES
jgi:hypothetical protein